jgi:RHS repeat-associated protein
MTAEDNGSGYRFGYNGKEKDDDIQATTGVDYDYGLRMYDVRIAKFMSLDLVSNKFPSLSPYQYASNRPIDGIDLEGAENYSYLYKITDKGAVLLSVVDYTKTEYHNNDLRDGVRIRIIGRNGKISDTFIDRYYPNVQNSITNAIETLLAPTRDESKYSWSGSADGAHLARMTDKDLTVGLGIVGLITGVGAVAEAGTLTVAGAISLANSLDDASGAFTKGDGSALQDLTTGQLKRTLTAGKALAAFYTAGAGSADLANDTKEIYKKAATSLSTVNDAISGALNAKSAIKTNSDKNK